MSYQQLVKPNLNIQYVGGWCERAAENTVGQSGIYGSAYKAWLANVQHKGNPPKGFYVPVYLSMPNGPKDPDGTQQGDVAISCPDGSVAAAAMAGVNKPLYVYPSLQAYLSDYASNNGGATLLGWGEYIGTIKVIAKEVKDMLNSKGQLDWIAKAALKRPATTAEIDRFLNRQTYNYVINWYAEQAKKAGIPTREQDAGGELSRSAVLKYISHNMK